MGPGFKQQPSDPRTCPPFIGRLVTSPPPHRRGSRDSSPSPTRGRWGRTWLQASPAASQGQSPELAPSTSHYLPESPQERAPQATLAFAGPGALSSPELLESQHRGESRVRGGLWRIERKARAREVGGIWGRLRPHGPEETWSLVGVERSGTKVGRGRGARGWGRWGHRDAGERGLGVLYLQDP